MNFACFELTAIPPNRTNPLKDTIESWVTFDNLVSQIITKLRLTLLDEPISSSSLDIFMWLIGYTNVHAINIDRSLCRPYKEWSDLVVLLDYKSYHDLSFLCAQMDESNLVQFIIIDFSFRANPISRQMKKGVSEDLKHVGNNSAAC